MSLSSIENSLRNDWSRLWGTPSSPASRPTPSNPQQSAIPARSPDRLVLSGAARSAGKPVSAAVEGMASGGGPVHAELSNGTIAFLGHLGVQLYSSVKGAQEGAAAGTALVNAAKSVNLDGMITAGKELGGVGLEMAGQSAGLAAGVSLVTNGIAVFNHQETFAQAGSNVVGDTIGGAAGGAGGAIAGAIGMAALGALGVAGFPLTIGAAVVGMVGYYFADKAIRGTGAFSWVKNTVYDMLSGDQSTASVPA